MFIIWGELYNLEFNLWLAVTCTLKVLNGFSMLPKCLNCQESISLAWFVVARMSTKYRCTECGALHEFTQRHKLIGIIAVIPLLFLVNLLEPFVTISILRFVIVLAIAVTVMVFIPKQHTLSDHDNFKEEIKNND